LGLLIHAAWAGWRGFGHSVLGLLLGLSFLFVFYLLGGMGAGDVKLMGAAGALLGAPHVAYAFVLTGLLGGLMAMAFKMNNPTLIKIPYGVAIGAGMVLSFLVVGGPYA
jgi:prepilin peptidase CpaA